MTIMARVGLIESQESDPLGFPTTAAGGSAVGLSSAAFSDTLAGSWIGNGAIGTGTDAPMGY